MGISVEHVSLAVDQTIAASCAVFWPLMILWPLQLRLVLIHFKGCKNMLQCHSGLRLAVEEALREVARLQARRIGVIPGSRVDGDGVRPTIWPLRGVCRFIVPVVSSKRANFRCDS